MLFVADVDVATTNTAAAVKEQILGIAHGIISRVSVEFPSGCHGQVHCVILHHEHQVFPSTEGMSLSGDTTPIEWDEYYESYQPPYGLKIKAWGVGCDYAHTITIRVAVLPRKAILALAITDAIKGVFGMLSPKRIFTRTGAESEVG